MRAAGAQYSVLSIQRLRGRGSVPIGVILLDPAKDMLWGRFREDLAEIADEDELDVLEGMADMIATRAREEGATRLFHGLLDTLSNYVRMEEPRTLPDPLDWSAAADRLFEERIQNPRGAAG